MSIYASTPGIDDDAPCGAPWTYLGSHVLPTEDDPRGGAIELAIIPGHITRAGTGHDRHDDGRPWPWLRLSVESAWPDPSPGAVDLILSPAQARHLATELTAWADWATTGADDHGSRT